MDRATKETLVSTYSDVLTQAGVVVVAHYAGLSVSALSDLRRALQVDGGQLKVVKNRLVKLALGDSVPGASDLFSGPTALIWSSDPVSAPKIAQEFAEENKNLKITGGLMEGKVLDTSAVRMLASLPSLDALRGKLIGVIAAPATGVAAICVAPAGQLARLVAARPEAA